MMSSDSMGNFIGMLLKASDVAKMWHWKVRSFSMHMALGELYEGLEEMTDSIMEMYMGKYGTEAHVPLSDPNPFSEQDATEFVHQLHAMLEQLHDVIPQDGFIVNKFEELQALVAQTKYKVDNLA